MTGLKALEADPRIFVRRAGSPDPEGRCVVYWMQRAQRAIDNPALDTAIALGNELDLPVMVFFAPVPFYPHANLRHFAFLSQGIPDTAAGITERNAEFIFRPYPEHSLLKFCEHARPAIVVGDENPLRETEGWRVKVGKRLRLPFWTVDADVVVPSRLLGREHFAARTIRPRILELLPQFLKPSRNPKARVSFGRPGKANSKLGRNLRATSSTQLEGMLGPDGMGFMSEWNVDRSVVPVSGFTGGSAEGLRRLKRFVRSGIAAYPKERNHPEHDGTSRLSPYLHFGHLSPLTIALKIERGTAPLAAKQAFLEQLIVRRELAVNFVRYNAAYDSFESQEPWAERSFARHAGDARPVSYTEAQLERAETHDPLWNAAQLQMVQGGWMHNTLRMYWAKKILEWSPSVSEAYQRAVRLNDRYELDGRDPNGYAGIAWAIVGKHDRPWFERPIFGQVRYMSMESTGKKFDSRRYIRQQSDGPKD